MRLKKILEFLNKRKESYYENAGFLSGIVLGILIGLFQLYLFIAYKEAMLNDLEHQLSIAQNLEIDISKLYLIMTIITPLLIVFVHILLGVLFGSFITKKVNGSKIFIILSSVIIGLIFGFITNSPMPRIFTVVIVAFAWIVFGILQIVLISVYERKNEK